MSWSSSTRSEGKKICFVSFYFVLMIPSLEFSGNYRVHRIQKIVEGPVVFSPRWFSLEYVLPNATESSQMHLWVALLLPVVISHSLAISATWSFSLTPKALVLIVCFLDVWSWNKICKNLPFFSIPGSE